MNEEQKIIALIRAELENKQKRNTSYSLRAFARDLEIDSSLLSKVLKGKRPLNESLMEKLEKKISFPSSLLNQFYSLTAAKKEVKSFSLKRPTKSFGQIKLDTFELIKDYRHYAVLELLKLDSFTPSLEWVAGALQANLEETRVIVERLEDLGLLERAGENWSDTSEGFTSHVLGPNTSSEAHKNYQQRLLKLAIESIDKVDLSKRDNSSMMMATSLKKIQGAKLLIKDFRRKLCEYLEDTDSKEAVFNLSISLNPCSSVELPENKEQDCAI